MYRGVELIFINNRRVSHYKHTCRKSAMNAFNISGAILNCHTRPEERADETSVLIWRGLNLHVEMLFSIFMPRERLDTLRSAKASTTQERVA